MATVTDRFREALHQSAVSAAAALDVAVTRAEAEPVVAAALETYLGAIEIPRAVLEYYVDEYVAVANAPRPQPHIS